MALPWGQGGMREEVAPSDQAKASEGGGGGGDGEGGGVVEPLPEEVPEVLVRHLRGVRCLLLQDAWRKSHTFYTSRTRMHLTADAKIKLEKTAAVQFGLLKYYLYYSISKYISIVL